jgi:glutamate racemase
MASATQQCAQRMAIIDSGLGGISVVRAIRHAAPELPLLYAADTAGFPYGGKSADEITLRGALIVEALQREHALQRVVVACNTLSTLSLAALRAQFPHISFVGTVPAIKVAAESTQSKRFTLLATPNTAHSPYSKLLIDQFAQDCVVDAHGAPELARLSERYLLGDSIADVAWQEQIAPCFYDDARGRTDTIILGCTHYPLVLKELKRLSPWPVAWIDSSQAIARQAVRDCANTGGDAIAYVTHAGDCERYGLMFAREGLGDCRALELTAAPAQHAAHG